MRIGVPDMVSNSYFPAIAAVDLGAFKAEGLDAVPFPPRQTTICPLGPSSVAPITSALRRFRSEFEARITRRDSLSVQAAPVAEGAPA